MTNLYSFGQAKKIEVNTLQSKFLLASFFFTLPIPKYIRVSCGFVQHLSVKFRPIYIQPAGHEAMQYSCCLSYNPDNFSISKNMFITRSFLSGDTTAKTDF